MSELWYRLEDCLPSVRVRVRVLVGGHAIEAMRWHRRGTKRRWPVIAWATIANDKVVYLRKEPEAWQPLYPELYQAPLVNGFRLDEDPQPPPALPPREREWWRDAGTVRYSLPGGITPREAEGRVMRALWAETAFERADTIYSPTPLSWLAKMIEMAEMAAGQRASYWHDRFQPTARDIGDFTTIVAWLRELAEREYIVLRMKAENPPYSLPEIAAETGLSVSGVRYVYREAILAVTTAANAQPIKPTTHAARRARDIKAGVASHAAAT